MPKNAKVEKKRTINEWRWVVELADLRLRRRNCQYLESFDCGNGLGILVIVIYLLFVICLLEFVCHLDFDIWNFTMDLRIQ